MFLSRFNQFLLLVCISLNAHAFVSRSVRRRPVRSMEMMPDVVAFSNNLLIATIDSDIANIPTNEFRTVFLGGLGVMAGGLLSAIAVGAMLEASDGYAAVVAESYDLEADEEFWKGLSDEEAKKAREMLAKVKAQKGEALPEETTLESTTSRAISTSSDDVKAAANPSTDETKADPVKKEVDMFSDY